MKVFNIKFWVNPAYIVKMIERYLDDGCEFDLHITCQRTRFGKQNYRGVTLKFTNRCSYSDVVKTRAWIQDATDEHAYFQSMQYESEL